MSVQDDVQDNVVFAEIRAALTLLKALAKPGTLEDNKHLYQYLDKVVVCFLQVVSRVYDKLGMPQDSPCRKEIPVRDVALGIIEKWAPASREAEWTYFRLKDSMDLYERLMESTDELLKEQIRFELRARKFLK